MLRIFWLVVMLSFAQLSFAQVRATTESGNKVLLFENGTWQYEENKVTPAAQEITPAGIVVASSVNVDPTKEISTDFQEIFKELSPRMVKYFGEERGQIRCKLSCSNNLGSVQVHYIWEMPVGDGNRYYGYFKEGSKMIVHLFDGQTVELLVGEDSTIKTMEKYNFTAISGVTQKLTPEQLSILTSQPVRKLEVDWKKKPEEYEVASSRYFIETLPLVF